MGKQTIFTEKHETILSEIRKSEYLRERFYFTGGTALAAYYLQHRYSDDLDFFTETELEPEIIFQIVDSWQKKYHFAINSRLIENITYRFSLKFPDDEILLLDFSKYQKRIEKSQVIEGIVVDSLKDIATNKLLVIQQRSDIKDFVDLMFLLKTFTIWDLSYCLKKKFSVEFEPYLFAVDCLKVEEFETLPRMILPVTLPQVQDYYRDLSLRFGNSVMDA